MNDCLFDEISPEEITDSISHLVYRMATLTNEENPIDSEDRKAITRLWLLSHRICRISESNA